MWTGGNMISILSKKYNSDNISLYYDNRETLVDNKKNIKRNNSKNVQSKGLQIIIKCNLKIIDYLFLTLNLNNGTNHRTLNNLHPCRI